MKAISHMRGITVAVGFFMLLSQAHGQENSQPDPITLFYKYLDLNGQLSDQGLPAEGREALSREVDRIRAQILQDGEQSEKAFIHEYSVRKLRGGKTFQGNLMTFARQTGLAKSEFAEFAREVILETDLSAPRDPLLTTALEYLGEHGEESDLELMSRLDGHVNQTYAQIRDRFAERLRERLGLGDGARVKAAADSSAQPEVPEQSGPTGLLDANRGTGSTNRRVPLNGIVSVVALTILALLIWAFMRRRAS